MRARQVALYFSAHWCPPCRGFTPQLAAAYEMAQEDELPFEIVFVSSDESAEAQSEYMREMHGHWLCVPHAAPQRNALKQKYGQSGTGSSEGLRRYPRHSARIR